MSEKLVVCVPVTAQDERAFASSWAAVQHSSATVPLVIAGRADLTAQLAQRLVELVPGRPTTKVDRGGECAAVNAAVEASRPADIVLLRPGVIPTEKWLEGLQAAARSDSTIATATPMSLGSGGVRLVADAARAQSGDTHSAAAGADAVTAGRSYSVEEGERVAREVRERSLRLYPRIATMGPGCVYIRRAAWDLAGPLDDALPLDRALQAMALKLLALGMVHVAVDDVVVVGEPSRVERDATTGRARAHDGESPPAAREEELRATIWRDERGPLRRTLAWGRVALGGMSITIDGRSLTSAVGGTQTYVIGLIRALARERVGAVRALVAPDIPAGVLAAITETPGVEVLSYEDALRDPPPSDVVHRPQQVFTPDDLQLLRLVGRRVVVGQQDLIAYHNYSYHPDVERWRAYRRTTRLALFGADQVVFFSEHARRDALAEDLLPESRAHVVGIGPEPPDSSGHRAVAPAGLDASERFLLCLGADYAHKNRPFAIELLRELRELGFDGRLVLAGSHVPHGSSREREAELLAADPDLAEHVLDLGPVDEASKRWLYARARALLYPTVYEGFGLIPLEAAHAGLPCLFAPQASLAEIAPGAATLTPWDARASAHAALPLLDDGPARDEHVRRLRGIAVPTWQQIARELLEVYEQTLSAPAPGAAPHVWQELDRERYIVALDRDRAKLKEIAEEYQEAYHRLERRVEFGLPLIDTGGLLSRRQQRGLMRVAARGRMGAMLLSPLGLLGRGGEREGGAPPD